MPTLWVEIQYLQDGRLHAARRQLVETRGGYSIFLQRLIMGVDDMTFVNIPFVEEYAEQDEDDD